MKWGVFEITKLDLEKNECKIKFLPDEKDFKKPKKITWLPD